MTNQRRDDGAIIGYKPKLEYRKKVATKVETEQVTSTNYDGVKFSKTLNSIAQNLPSVALSNLDFVTDNIKMLMNELTKSFADGDWNEYGNISSLMSAVESNNKEYIDAFINYHSNLITGSIVPELIGALNTTRRRLVLLNNTLKKLYYNDKTLTTEQAQAIDADYLKQIQKYEVGNEQNKINYLAISQDSILNRSVSLHAFDVNEKAINLSEVVLSTDSALAKKEQGDLIKQLYDETNQGLNYHKSTYDEEQSINTMTQTLYNYYDKRKDVNDMYTVLDTSTNSVFIARKTKEYKDRLNEAIVNVNKAFTGNAYYLSELTSLEQEKALLMNIYSTFNYNSEN